jgi:hypothetical protein
MARDTMQPGLDRVSYGEIEGMGLSPRSSLGFRDWDGTEVSRSGTRPANQDIPALPVTASSQVADDTDGGADDFDFTVASY